VRVWDFIFNGIKRLVIKKEKNKKGNKVKGKKVQLGFSERNLKTATDHRDWMGLSLENL